MICPMDFSDFDKMYAIMSSSFPSDEYRPYLEQKALLTNPRYRIFSVYDDISSEMKAFIAVWNFDSFLYVEHFAVNPDFRNEGLGSRVLADIQAMFPKRICLEVEPPQTELSERRIAFYKRNGFYLNNYPYVQPPISKGRSPVPLMIMTTNGVASKDEHDSIKRTLYKHVYSVPAEES